METKYKLICMSWNGDFVEDSYSNDIEVLKNNSNEMGSKWIFYPYHFICTEKTVKIAGENLEEFNGKSITTVVSEFEKAYAEYIKNDT